MMRVRRLTLSYIGSKVWKFGKSYGRLVGGLEHFLNFSIQLGISSSQLTFTPSFFRGVGQPPTRKMVGSIRFHPVMRWHACARPEMRHARRWKFTDSSMCRCAVETHEDQLTLFFCGSNNVINHPPNHHFYG